jgi:uncharacterized integral membrane protein
MVRSRRVLRWVWLAMALVIAAVFAYLNAGERVAIHVGFAVLYQLPLVWLVFGVYLLGMATMYGLGFRHDLRVRRVLREHGLDERPDPPDDYEPPVPLPPDPYP